MKLGIMQPYFFPYLGYFSLIRNTDKLILIDEVQFIKQGWIDRNRILNSNGGWIYVRIPLMKHSQKTLIKNVKIKNSEDWKNRLLRQLIGYKKIAPFYLDVTDFLKNLFDFQTDSITHLNAYLLKKTCDYLGIDFDCEIFSEMNLVIDEVTCPNDWALNISKALGASVYINPPGGKSLFDYKKFSDNKIGLKFLQVTLNEYNQKRPFFEKGLSVLDVMMFNTPEQIRRMLDDFKFV